MNEYKVSPPRRERYESIFAINLGLKIVYTHKVAILVEK
jgi:hypothetical protein